MSTFMKWSPAIALTALSSFSSLAAAETVVRYVHTDALGSVAVITDQNRTVVDRREYEPYGQQLTLLENGPGFTGHVQDAATGLTYMQQRYYDPAMGVFLSVDPVAISDGWKMQHFNRYAYAYDNPSKFTDPDGRCPWCLGAVIGIGLEVTRQIVTGEIKDTSFEGVVANVGKAFVAGAAGATGAGIAGQVAKLTTSVAVRAAANGAAGSAIGVVSTGANNAIDGKDITTGMGTSAAVGAVGGAGGSLIGDGIDVVKSALNANAVQKIPFAERQLLEHMSGAAQGTGRSSNPSAVGTAAAASNLVSNSGGVVESCGIKKEC